MIRIIASGMAAAVLTACAPGTPIAAPGAVDVDVDTPALRAQKAAAGVEPCVAPTTPRHELGSAGLPDVSLPCLGGGDSVDLARLRGPLVITFWASWCGPCRRELPIFQRFAKKYAGHVGVLGIDYKDVRPDAALELVAESGVTFPLLADVQEAVGTGGLRVTLLPTLAFLDEDGRLTAWSDDGVDEQGKGGRVRALEIESLEELEQLAAEHLGQDALVTSR